MKDNTSYCSVGFNDRGIESALDAIAAAGFPQVELSSNEPHVSTALTGTELSAFRARIEQRGLRARTVHAPSKRCTLGATDEVWRATEAKRLADYIRFSADVGATDMVIHPIPNPIFVPNADDPSVPGLIVQGMRKSLDELVPVAQAAGIHINLENLPYHHGYPFQTTKELRTLVDEYPEALGLIVDIGHTAAAGIPLEDEIRAAGPRLNGLHINDAIGPGEGEDHHPPHRGVLDWDRFLSVIKEVGYTGPFTFEVIVTREGETRDELCRVTRKVAMDWGATGQ